MKVVRISREISHGLSVGGFEVIKPTVRVTAELTDNEDPVEAVKQLDQIVEKMWNQEALSELRQVHLRRQGETPKDDKLPGLMTHFKSVLAK